MLSSWNVDFVAVNVEGNGANLAELHRLGAPNGPAVAVKERIVHGWQPRMYAELVGVEYDPPYRGEELANHRRRPQSSGNLRENASGQQDDQQIKEQSVNFHIGSRQVL